MNYALFRGANSSKDKLKHDILFRVTIKASNYMTFLLVGNIYSYIVKFAPELGF